MKLAHPSLVAVRFYTSPEGVRFRPNNTNPTAVWNKLAPVQEVQGWGRIVYYSNYINLIDNAKPFLSMTMALPHDAPIETLRAAHLIHNDEVDKALRDHDHLGRIVDGAKSDFNKGMDGLIVKYYKLGVPVKNLCTMFQVGRARVTGAITRSGAMLPEPTEEQKQRSQIYRNKNEALNKARKDDRYRAIASIDSRLRSRAKAMRVLCSYHRESLLVNVDGELTLPDTCPILGVQLRYLEPMASRDYYPDNSASITRYDTTKPYVNGNVLIASRLGCRLNEDTIGIAAKLKALEDPAILAAWAAWRQR